MNKQELREIRCGTCLHRQIHKDKHYICKKITDKLTRVTIQHPACEYYVENKQKYTLKKFCCRCDTAKDLWLFPYQGWIKGVHIRDSRCSECHNSERRGHHVHNPKYNRKRKLTPLQSKAKCKMAWALKTGRLKKPDACEVCHEKPRVLQGHHADYNKPLDVIWCCSRCHCNFHKKIILPKKEEFSWTGKKFRRNVYEVSAL